MTCPFTVTQLAAFLEGSLDDEALTDAIEAAINADPALADRVEALAGGDDAATIAVRNAFAAVLDAPVPEHLSRVIAAQPESAQVVDFAAARSSRVLPVPANHMARSSWRWPQFGAMAASLALGVIVGGLLLTGDGTGSDGAPAGGSLVFVSADLIAMLDTAPSGQAVNLASLGTGEVVLTFRNVDGQLCRQFMLAGSAGTSDALACAGQNGGWQVEAFGRRAAPAGEMKLAGGDAAVSVVAAVDDMIDSDPLMGADEAAELAAK